MQAIARIACGQANSARWSKIAPLIQRSILAVGESFSGDEAIIQSHLIEKFAVPSRKGSGAENLFPQHAASPTALSSATSSRYSLGEFGIRIQLFHVVMVFEEVD